MRNDEIRTLFDRMQGMEGGREEIGMGPWQEVTSVVYSERLQTKL